MCPLANKCWYVSMHPVTEASKNSRRGTHALLITISDGRPNGALQVARGESCGAKAGWQASLQLSPAASGVRQLEGFAPWTTGSVAHGEEAAAAKGA